MQGTLARLAPAASPGLPRRLLHRVLHDPVEPVVVADADAGRLVGGDAAGAPGAWQGIAINCCQKLAVCVRFFLFQSH